jgi:8-oxo-dGTP pyrophosphatase MutT (NUDIX family)
MALTPWDSLATELVVDHRWYRLRRDTVRLPSGRVVDDYFVSERVDVVLVFAVTPEGSVVFVHQWKQGRRAFYTELPGGMCDPDEESLETAARELREETGYACDGLRQLGLFEPDPTKTTNAIVAFLGTGARLVADPLWDEQEELEVRLLPVSSLQDAIRSGEITSAGTVATVYRALDELGHLT